MRELLLPILKKEQKKKGFISEEAIKRISEETKLPVSRIYGVATFYSFLHTKKQGKNIIYVCDSPSCRINGSLDTIKTLENELKIKAGNTTKNNKFSLYKTSCIGCCNQAPAMLMNGKAHTNLNEAKIKSILKKCRF